jgi:hypothetical protein
MQLVHADAFHRASLAAADQSMMRMRQQMALQQGHSFMASLFEDDFPPTSY